MKYSLANYILSVQPNDPALTANQLFKNIKIGGEGSALDTITLTLANNLYDTTSFATGGYIHNKNLARNGTATITISQLSDSVAKFKQMCNVFYGGEYAGFTLSLSDNTGVKVATCTDCYIQKIPDQSYASTAGTQQWVFVCGEITVE